MKHNKRNIWVNICTLFVQCGLAVYSIIDSRRDFSLTDKAGATVSQRITLVAGHKERRQFVELGVQQRFESRSRRVRGVKQVDDLWTCRPELRHCRINRKDKDDKINCKYDWGGRKHNRNVFRGQCVLNINWRISTPTLDSWKHSASHCKHQSKRTTEQKTIRHLKVKATWIQY